MSLSPDKNPLKSRNHTSKQNNRIAAAISLREDAIRHPPKVVLVENGFLIPNPSPNHCPNPNPNPKPNFGYQ